MFSRHSLLNTFKVFYFSAFICALTISHAYSQNLKDRLIYKIDTQIYFLADINDIIDKIKTFNCALGTSFVLSEYKIEGLKKLSYSQDLSLKKSKLRNILKLLKTMKYIEKENLALSKKVRNLFIESVKEGSCGKVDFKELNHGSLVKLLQMEMYMKRRFHLSQYNISAPEFKKQRVDFSKYSDKKAMFLIKQRKQKIAIKDFLKSLNSQIKHREYF